MTKLLAPISIGELVDKINILEIKYSKLQNKGKISNVEKELKLLKNIYIEMKIDIDNNLHERLKSINLLLWDFENKIREKEKKLEFDEEFTELARSVYKENDKIADTKKI